MLGFIKTRASFQMAQPNANMSLSSSFVPVKTNQIAGVFNPHKLQRRKIAIRATAYINISRWLVFVRLGSTNSVMGLTSLNFSWFRNPQFQTQEP